MSLLSRVLALAPFPVSRPFAFLLVRSRLSLLSVLLSFSFFSLIVSFAFFLGLFSLSVSPLALVLSRSLHLSFLFSLGLFFSRSLSLSVSSSAAPDLGYFRFLMFVLVLFRSISTPPKFILVQSCFTLADSRSISLFPLTLVQSR